MQDFIATSERRAQLYAWFSSLFAAPLDQQEIAEYEGYDGRAFLKSLATLDPMKLAVAQMTCAIETLLTEPLATSLLTQEFSALQQHLRAANRPDTHFNNHQTLAEQLTQMTHYIEQSLQSHSHNQPSTSLQNQATLLRARLIPYFTFFMQNIQPTDNIGFYPAVCHLFEVFLRMDDHYLTLVYQPLR